MILYFNHRHVRFIECLFIVLKKMAPDSNGRRLLNPAAALRHRRGQRLVPMHGAELRWQHCDEGAHPRACRGQGADAAERAPLPQTCQVHRA